MILPTSRGRITLREAASREQSKALARLRAAASDTGPVARDFHEPCFRCGSSGACRHRKAYV